MAGLAGGRETGSGVVRVISRVVVSGMATDAGCRRVVVISIGVALIATGACMCAGQGPVRIVHCKSSGRPVRRGRVAGCAVMG